MRDHAYASLVGTAVGDAFGANLGWRWTDDTEMACSVFHVLDNHGHVDQDALAASFVAHHDVGRGYGAGIDGMMREVGRGANLRELARRSFGGTGSWGNGAAMRVAPLGAWFSGDPARAAAEAAASASVTHTHPDGVAGAVAVAVPGDLFAEVLRHTPPGRVRDGVEKAAVLDVPPRDAAATLGTGARVSAPDSVPFALWAAARHLDDYAGALREVAALADDVDTLCAIVGGVVAARVGVDGIPARWRASVEPLPNWV